MIKINSKPHRQNSKFQLRYFLAGDCKTPDGAWSLLYSQKIDMEGKLRHADSQRLRRDAKIAAAQEIIDDNNSKPSAVLNAQADIAEQLADVPVWELNLAAAKQELQDIVEIMKELEPFRKYGHLDILEATEAAQQAEWLEELKTRAENFLITAGTIPHDHLNTMRCHPEFKTVLVPHIQNQIKNIRGADLVDSIALLEASSIPLVEYDPKPIVYDSQEIAKLDFRPKR